MARPKTSETPPGASAAAFQSWLAVARAYNLCDAVLTERLASLGVRMADHEVLVNLHRAPGITQQQLAQRCFVAKSGVSMLVTRMEGEGLLRREADPGDARMRRLSLTAEGEALAARALQVQGEVLAAMVAGSSLAELAVITQAMQRASEALASMRQAPQ